VEALKGIEFEVGNQRRQQILLNSVEPFGLVFEQKLPVASYGQVF